MVGKREKSFLGWCGRQSATGYFKEGDRKSDVKTVGLVRTGSSKDDVLGSSVGRSSRMMSRFSTGRGFGVLCLTGGVRCQSKPMGRKVIWSLQHNTLLMNVLVNETDLSIA